MAYKYDLSKPVGQFVDELIEQMTLKEKIGQLNQVFSGRGFEKLEEFDEQIKAGEIGSFIWAETMPQERNRLQTLAVEESRLGIPIIFGMDIIHGNRTIFPIAPAMACSFEPELFERTQAVAAKETRAEGVEWTFAPMCDMARDGRWGRVAETCGEDPYLSSLCNAAQVRGFQGDDPSSPDRVAACLKHYVGYSVPRGGRDYSDTEITEWSLRNVHLPPFKYCVERGALTIMSSFNAIGGVPSVANKHTLTEILREEWGFKGFVVSDWNAVLEQISWGFTKDEAESAEAAITAGNDMDMLSLCYIKTLEQQVKDGKVPVDVIDTAVRRVLTVKYKVGLFENPYVDENASEKVILLPESRNLAREAVAKSTVLVKNNQVLPLSDRPGKIALIGPFADDKAEMIGVWSGHGKPDDAVTLKEALEHRFGADNEIVTVKGCAVSNQPQMICLQDGSTVVDQDASEDVDFDIEGAVKAAEAADVVIMALGEPRGFTGEGGSRGTMDVTGHQLELFNAVAEAVDKPIVSIVFSGRGLAAFDIFEKSSAVLLAWQPGVEAGNGIVDLISGDVAPSARLSMSVPYCVGQLPLYYNHYVTGRKTGGIYRDAVPTSAYYWFGYGLTYTDFEYSDVELIKGKDGNPSQASVTVSNVGLRSGVETVQLYIRQLACRNGARPMQELRGFKKVELEPGGRSKVTFDITDEVLGYVNIHGEFCVDEGDYNIWIAPHSRVGEPVLYTHCR